MKTQHTPGPWINDYDRYSAVTVIQPNDIVAVADFGKTRLPEDEASANARLIAAAPDLLEALQMVCDSGCPLSDEITDKMLSAIAKATSE